MCLQCGCAQPGLGWVTVQPGDCLILWHFLLRAPALQPQVRPPLSYGWACSKSESRACREHGGKVQVRSRTWTRWRSVSFGW